MTVLEGLYIFDEHNSLIFNHVYTEKPPPPAALLPLYLQQSTPRPSVLYLSSFSPPCILISAIHDNLLFFSPVSHDIDTLLVLEFLHRVADALEEFLGSPLLATKITSNYDIVSQVVAEIADAGIICQGEANALRDVVETGPGVLRNLLGGVGLPNSSPGLQPPSISALQMPGAQSAQSSQGSAIPWRRSNVRHTSNELYVDIIESLSVIMAPSGRPLSASANGSIAFTSKVSGVPDLLLSLSLGGKGGGMGSRGDQLRSVMERVVFHPCVRLNRWKTEGVLSFIPPDGRFALCGYETDLLGPELDITANPTSAGGINLPASLEVTTGLGTSGSEFEVRVFQPSGSSAGSRSAATTSLQSHLNASRPLPFRAASGGDSKTSVLENLTVHVPIPPTVRSVSDIRPSRGEAHWNPADGGVEWKIPIKDFGYGHGVVLRCTVQGGLAGLDADDTPSGVVAGMSATTYDYDEQDHSIAASADRDITPSEGGPEENSDTAADQAAQTKQERNRALMPTSATISFSVKGWLASGIKVESLVVDMKKSRGLGQEVKPYKGVKYLTVSQQGVEIRC